MKNFIYFYSLNFFVLKKGKGCVVKEPSWECVNCYFFYILKSNIKTFFFFKLRSNHFNKKYNPLVVFLCQYPHAIPFCITNTQQTKNTQILLSKFSIFLFVTNSNQITLKSTTYLEFHKLVPANKWFQYIFRHFLSILLFISSVNKNNSNYLNCSKKINRKMETQR